MPYISKNNDRREKLRKGEPALIAGELNYQIFYYVKHNKIYKKVNNFVTEYETNYKQIKEFVDNFLGEKPNYQRYNDMTGCLLRCARELKRRLGINAKVLISIMNSYDDEMKLFYTYLIGAIEKDTKDGGQSWRNDITPALDKAGIYVQDPCLEGNTPILTANLIYKPIKEIKVGEVIYGLKGNYLTQTIVTEVHKRKAMTYKLEFEDGRYLIVTENHPILQYKINRDYRWAKPKELKQTRLCIHPNYSKDKNWIKGYLLGFLDGDGNITRDDKLRFFQKDKGQLEYIEHLLEKLYAKINGSYYRDLRTGVYTLGIYSPILSRKIIKDIAFPKNCIGNNSYFRGYLAGIYDAEGWKKGYDQVIVSNTNPTIIYRIRRCLLLLGHKYKIKKLIYDRKTPIYRITFQLNIQPQRANFIIECQPYQRQHFLQGRYQIRNSKILKVKSLIPFKKISVYNFETTVHNYIANGVIVHNCLTEPLVTGMNVIEAQDKFNRWIISGNYDKFAQNFKKVVEKDIRMVHRSDFVIAHLFEDIPTTGGIHEMAEAWRLKKKIYLIWRGAKNKISKWALFLTTDSNGKIFDSPKQLTDYIALAYEVKRQSFRIQIIQYIKALFRTIGEKNYNQKLQKIKFKLPKLEEKKEESKKKEQEK